MVELKNEPCSKAGKAVRRQLPDVEDQGRGDVGQDGHLQQVDERLADDRQPGTVLTEE
jgi:hypothetical protein